MCVRSRVPGYGNWRSVVARDCWRVIAGQTGLGPCDMIWFVPIASWQRLFLATNANLTTENILLRASCFHGFLGSECATTQLYSWCVALNLLLGKIEYFFQLAPSLSHSSFTPAVSRILHMCFVNDFGSFVSSQLSISASFVIKSCMGGIVRINGDLALSGDAILLALTGGHFRFPVVNFGDHSACDWLDGKPQTLCEKLVAPLQSTVASYSPPRLWSRLLELGDQVVTEERCYHL